MATFPYQHLGDALAIDDDVLPAINDYWEAAELPWPLLRRLADLGLFAVPARAELSAAAS